MKKLLSLILVVFIAFGMLAGCGGGENKDSSTPGSQTNTDVSISKDDVAYIDANGDPIYTIIRPQAIVVDEKKNEEIITLGEDDKAMILFKKMKSTLGVSLRNASDENDGTDAYEILIGATNREESKKALEYLESKTGSRYNDWIICTIGKKIVINANNADGLDAAVKYFYENYVNKDGIKGGIEYIYKAEGNWKDITINGTSIGKFTIVRPHFNSSYLTQLNMESLVESIYKETGYMLNIKYDEYTEAGEYEILVGNNNREGIKTITNYDEFDITIKGTKVYLNGGSAHATAMAVSEFSKLALGSASITDANSVSGSYEATMANYDRATTYYPTYVENFDGDQIDTTKWRLMKGSEFRKDGQNGKLSGMTDNPDFVFQRDGKFYIYGHEDAESYYGATLVNNKTMRFRYGYVEHSVICPDGDGFWSLLWFDNRGDAENVLFGAEIDLNECFGNGSATQANCHKWPTAYGQSLGYEHASLDGKEYGADKKYYCPDGKTWADDYHTFGFLWDETQMSFTADGEIWFTYRIDQTPEDIDAFVDAYLYMKLSFSVGRYNNNLLVNNLTPEEWANTNVLICDWIYLYQLQDGKQDLIYK